MKERKKALWLLCFLMRWECGMSGGNIAVAPPSAHYYANLTPGVITRSSVSWWRSAGQTLNYLHYSDIWNPPLTEEAPPSASDRSEDSSDDSLMYSSSTNDVARLLPSQPASALQKQKGDWTTTTISSRFKYLFWHHIWCHISIS